MARLGNIKDWAAGIFIGAEQRGVFDKLPAFQRDLSRISRAGGAGAELRRHPRRMRGAGRRQRCACPAWKN